MPYLYLVNILRSKLWLKLATVQCWALPRKTIGRAWAPWDILDRLKGIAWHCIFTGTKGKSSMETEYLCLNWMSEFSPFYQNSRYSRFLIAMIPSDMYWKAAVKTNLTLQCLLQAIVQSIQTLETTGAGGLHATCVVFKGDWKFSAQSMSLRHHPGTDRICWCCPATKSLRCPYVDMSPHALWRTTPDGDGPPWHSEPATKSLTSLADHRPRSHAYVTPWGHT